MLSCVRVAVKNTSAFYKGMGGDCSPFYVDSVHLDSVTHLGARAVGFEMVGMSGEPVPHAMVRPPDLSA